MRMRTAAVAVATAGALVTGMGTAQAATYNLKWQAGQYDYFAIGKIVSSGNSVTFTVWDDHPDGDSAVLVWQNPSGSQSGKVWDHSGSADNTPGTHTVASFSGSNAYVKLCVGSYSTKTIKSCQGSEQPYPV